MNLRNFIRINRTRFFLFSILAILSPLLTIAMTALVQIETSIILSRNLPNFLIISAISLTVCIMFYALFSLTQYLLLAQTQDLNNSVREKIVDHYFHDDRDHPVSKIQSRLTNDLELINDNYYGSLLNLIFGVVQLIAIIIYLIMLSWALLITICIIVAISLALPKLIEKPLQKANKLISTSNEIYLDTLNDWLRGLDQLRQFAAGAKLFSVTQNASKKLEDATVKQTTYTKLLNAINGIASALFGLIIFVLTGFLVKNGLVQMSTLLIVGNFRFYLNQAINEISQARGEMKGVKSLIEEVNEAAEKVQVSDKQKTNMPTVIKTESLRLNFPNGEKLSYPDIQINQGEKILLTGDSGTGKSTLFKLILGELAPSAGKIIFEDKDGPQDPVIFPASIKENITMFNNKLDNKVEKSVEEVNLSADLQKFEEGINKQLDLDKLNISGGQRQKIVLARAQVHESDIILIDEGTSAIDQNSTIDILDKLLKSKATIVFIAHNFTEEMHELFDREIHLIKE